MGGCCCCLLVLHSRLPSFQYATRDTHMRHSPLFQSVPEGPYPPSPSPSFKVLRRLFQSLRLRKERGRWMPRFPFLLFSEKKGNFCSVTCSVVFCTTAQYNGGILFNSRLKRRAREGRSFSSVKKRLFEFLTHYSSFPLGSFFAL